MENDREFEQVLMSVKGATGGIVSASLITARLTFKLVVFLMRLVKKGILSTGFVNNFKSFAEATEGNYSIYNIPLTEEKAAVMRQLNELELKLETEKNPLKKRALELEKRNLQNQLPEIEQLKKLGVCHCVLPKLNGKDNTVQVAISNTDEPMFKNWYINHLTAALSGGKKNMEDIKVFTENNYAIFNMPFEGEEFDKILPDFDTLGINYAILPDLKVGDNNSQIAVPNADRDKLEMWFKMWRDKQLREGATPGEMYTMNQESYINTASISEGEYVAAADAQYQEVNAEYEKEAKNVPWMSALGKENSEEYVHYLKDSNYEKVTINRDTLVDNMGVSQKAVEMQKNGYFISRVPGTYGQTEKTLILPATQVFRTDEGKTFIAFLPKNRESLVADRNGNVSKLPFGETYAPYDRVKRGFGKVENLKKEMKPSLNPSIKPTPKMAAPLPKGKL